MVSVGYVIGIDLGTQNTRTAVFRDNTAEIVPHNGETSMPSCVAFTETCRLVGSAADSQAGLNPSNTIYGALRFVGGGFEKTGIEDTLSSVPFTVKVKAGRTYFVVRYRHQELITTPVEILAMILARAQRDAQSYLGQGCQISGAVITIPTAFDLCQRQAVWDAACIARINPLRLMSAAVMACAEYALASGSTKPQNIMCIDYGARSLDIAVAVIDEGVIDVVALDGDNLIGGQDVDSLLVRYIAKTFERKWKLDPTTKPRPLHRLRIACEKAKCELSSQKRTLITMDSLVEDRTFEWSLTQQDFEECCSSLFRASMKPVKRIVNDTLENARMNIGDITTVVVTGGSSRIPKFKSLLCKVMRGREIHEYQHQDCAAARGAAFYAAMLQGFIWSMAGIGLLVDVAPCPVRVQSFRGTTKTIFHKNMTFPQIKTATFKAPQDYEGPCRVAILEGFFAHNQDIVSVGNLDLQLLPTPHGIQEIEITVHYRTNHEIIVAAKVLGTDSQARISLSDPERLQEDALKRIMAEHLELNLEEQREESRILVKQATEGYVVRLLDEIAICSDTSATREKKLLATSVLDWLDENPEAEASAYRSQLYDLKIKIQNVDGAELGQNILVTAPSLEQGAESSNRRNPPDDVRQNGSSSRTQDEPLREHKTSNSHGDTSIVPESTTIEVLLPSQLLHPASPHASESGINVLFVNTAKTGRIYTDSDFLNISTYLGNTGHSSWSTVPRLYAVLRLLNQLDMLDTFIEQDITDIWFPFTQASLPSTLSPTVRASFLDQQQVVLSKSLLFEKSSERKHTHFAQNEPNPFQVVAKLGSGAHGQVDKVMSTVSHREYARKQFRRQKGTNKDAIKSFLIELQVLKRVQHHHCIELVHSYTDPKYFALLMNPVGECNLSEYYELARGSPDKLSLLRSFFGCLANALQYVHSIKIRHRDIKPQNVLVKGERVYLTDFGIALDWENLSRSTTTADSGKTLVYAASEVAQFEKRNTSADVWSLGCVFLEMVTVLKGETVASMRSFFEQRTSSYRFYANIPNLGPWAQKLRAIGGDKENTVFKWVRAMLDKEGDERPTAMELYEDIVEECTLQHVPFCGSCCVEDAGSSSVGDSDEDDLWEQAAELTIVPRTA